MGAPNGCQPTTKLTQPRTQTTERQKTEGYDYMFLFDAHYKRATRSNTNITDNTASQRIIFMRVQNATLRRFATCDITMFYKKTTLQKARTKKQLCNFTNATLQKQLCNFTYATLQM